jgi:hypothetical protein
MAGGVFSGDPLDLWERDSAMRERVRPIIADEAKSHQFLAAKRLILDSASRNMFLDYVTRDFFAALTLLARRARGDHGPDKWAEQFPRHEGIADPSLTAWALFERWIAKAKPANSTVDRWRAVFLRLQSDFPDANATALLPEQMQHWANGLINSNRTAHTVAKIWVRAARTVFAWAVDERLISRNPFVGWHVKVPKKILTRETKAFTHDEINLILSAALAIQPRSKGDAAKRWCPWLAAYSGARMGELTQLRGVDIIVRDGIHAMKISPEAGTTKTGRARTVPLHEHLIEQGFLAFVKANGNGAARPFGIPDGYIGAVVYVVILALLLAPAGRGIWIALLTLSALATLANILGVRDMANLGSFCFYCVVTTLLSPVLLWAVWELR